MKKILFVIYISLLSFAICQNFAGGKIPHFTTGIRVIQADAGTTIANGAIYPITLQSTFDANQKVNVATALLDFSFSRITAYDPNQRNQYATFGINGITINDARTQLSLTITTDPFGTTGATLPSQKFGMKRATLSYIVVGQNMDGPYDSGALILPSSYFFARNSKLATVVAGNPNEQTPKLKFDYDLFTGQTRKSPFNYDQTLNTRCGAVFRNDNWFIESKGCQRIVAYLQMTGFAYPTTPGNNPAGLEIKRFDTGTLLGSQQIELNDGATPFANSDADAGLSVTFVSTVTKVAQVSLVVIAIRQYNDATYPGQGTNIDQWKANSYITSALGNNAKGKVTIGTGSLVNVLQTATNEKKILQKNNYASTSYGHRFCGLNYYALQPTNVQVSNEGFILNSLDLGAQTFSLTLYPAADNQLDDGVTKTNFDYNCLLFTLKTATCQDTLQAVPLSNSNPVITASANVVANVAAVSAVATYKDVVGSNPDLKNAAQVIATQQFSGAGTVQYDFTISTATSKQGVYEGILYITGPLAAQPNVYENVDLRIFGNQIILKRQNILGTPFHFSFQNNNINDNKIRIVYYISPLATGALPALPAQTVEFGLIYHTKVLNAVTNACDNFCVDRVGFSVGSNTNENPPVCVQCQTAKNLVFDPVAEACSCLPGYFKNGANCQVCDITLCGGCSGSGCSQCVSHAIFVDLADPSKGCKCDEGYYRDNLQCKPCLPGCKTCTNGVACTLCKVAVGAVTNPTRQTPELGCACIDGYYETGNALCQKCSNECVTCLGQANTCKSCPEHATVSGTTCKCNDGYYFAINQNGLGVCLKCDSSCKTCAQDAAKCTECKTNVWKQQAGGACVCDQILRYVQYANGVTEAICVDRRCSTIDPNCAECQLVLGTGDRVCTKCNDLTNWILSADDNKKCECMAGFYLSGTNCVACGSGCQKCTSPTVCTTCALGFSTNVAGTCSCPAGTYLSRVDNTLQCLRCDANCALCQTTSSKCSSCINGFVAKDNVCTCGPKKFVTNDGLYCKNCLSGCQTCQSETKCTLCSPGYLPSNDNSQCLLECGAGFYNSGPSCESCSAGCAFCKSFIDCTTCSSGFYEYLGGCKDTCPKGTYPDVSGRKCIACNQNCAACSSNPNNCQECQRGFVIYNNQCLQKCPDRFYSNGVTCLPCSAACDKCQATADKCTSCPNTQFLYQNKCYTQCPTAIVNGVCTNICQDGAYLDGKVCRPCNANCKTCTSASFCTSCKGAFLSYKGQCITKCIGNTVQVGQICSDCDSSCIGCTGSTTTCVKCQPNFYRYGQKCYSVCPFRFYPDQTSFTCKPCDASCQICSGPGRCSLCIDNSAPTNGVCAVNCGAGCLQCSNSVCSKCAQNYYSVGSICLPACPAGSSPAAGQTCACNNNLLWYQGTCVQTCPDGFFKVGVTCQACDSPCKTCNVAKDKCESCIDGYNYDQVSKKCTKKSDCSEGQYLSTFGQCRFICPEGSYYLDSACYSGRCPVGYVKDNEKRICTKQTSPAGCSHPFFLQGSRCVSTCDQGFYANVNNRVCQVCSANCLSCSGPNVCECCNSGSTLSGNVCVILPDACPAGQYRFNDLCLSSCPSGTFIKNGFCVRLCNPGLYYYMMGCYESCSTNLYTSEACVLVCPVGFVKNGNKCLPVGQSCSSNQFFNAYIGRCEPCRSPCSSCAGTATFCTNCVQGFNLRGGSCFSQTNCPQGFYPSNQGCQKCAPKCNTCSDYNRCTSCASNFVNTGADCIPGLPNLQRLVLEVLSTVRCGNVVYIKIRPSILPNDLPRSLESSLLLLISNNPVPCQVNVWIHNGLIFVAIAFYNTIPYSQITLVPNSQACGSLFANIGYTTQNVLVTINISQSLEFVPENTYTIPNYSSYSQVYNSQTVNKVLNARLNLDVANALRQNDRIRK